MNLNVAKAPSLSHSSSPAFNRVFNRAFTLIDLAVLKTAYSKENLFGVEQWTSSPPYPIAPGAIYPTTCSGNIATVNDQLRTAPVPSFMASAPVAEFMFVKVDREVTDQQVQALPSVFCP